MIFGFAFWSEQVFVILIFPFWWANWRQFDVLLNFLKKHTNHSFLFSGPSKINYLFRKCSFHPYGSHISYREKSVPIKSFLTWWPLLKINDSTSHFFSKNEKSLRANHELKKEGIGWKIRNNLRFKRNLISSNIYVLLWVYWM